MPDRPATGTAGDTPPAIRARVVTITPKQAGALIEHKNNRNRTVVQSRVEQYAADMRRGDWRVNGEAIKVSIDGEVLDGQHRLLAILEADTPIETLLITGLPAEAQESMDQGKARTFGDVLKLRGEKDYYVLAAAVRIVATYERDGIPYSAGYSAAPSNHQLARTLKRNPEIRDSCVFANKRRRGWINVSLVAALHFLFSSVNPNDADDFFTRLASGENLDASSPIYVLRERLIAEHYSTDDRRLHFRSKAAFVVKAWNAYQDGTPLIRLVWNPGGAHPEAFPAIRGLIGETDEQVAA